MGLQVVMTFLSQFMENNSNVSGVETNGTLGCSGFTNGDLFYMTAHGK